VEIDGIDIFYFNWLTRRTVVVNFLASFCQEMAYMASRPAICCMHIDKQYKGDNYEHIYR